MESYYRAKLAGERLRSCYDLAPPRVRQYLQAEIDHVAKHVAVGARILELGCGYGRVLRELSRSNAAALVGVDISIESLGYARFYLAGVARARLAAMDAARLGLGDGPLDVVCCIQNGISSFNVDQRALLRSAVRVARTGGIVLFSSYADSFWEPRLDWFRIQARHGLLGEIDEAATRNGVIVCRDGFRATTVGASDFEKLASGLGRRVQTRVVDGSSVFCEISV
jgi:2-polyprenyl-6-hydroxyphenyl methylase/3-demethylubiquinone-9 3-methyltransferase